MGVRSTHIPRRSLYSRYQTVATPGTSADTPISDDDGRTKRVDVQGRAFREALEAAEKRSTVGAVTTY